MSKVYYPSKFNFVTNYNDVVILYNSKSGKMASFECTIPTQFDFLLRSSLEIKNCEDELLKFLIENEFVIDNTFDENNDTCLLYDKIVNSRELFLEILPTEKCNFRCAYCYETYDREAMNEKIISSVIQFVQSRISRCTSMKVAWFGGEPLLAINIIEELSMSFIRICNEAHIPYYSSITTNGYLLTPDVWKKLKRCHITDFQISIDGLAKTHNKQRLLANGDETWEVIIRNLEYFRDNIRTTTSNIILRTNITKEIYLQREQYISFLKEEFSQDKRFSFFFHLAQDWGNIKDEDIKKVFCGVEEFYQMLELAANNGLSLKIFRYFLSPAGRVCFAGKNNSFVICPDGNIRKCSFRLNDNKNLLGNVQDYNKVLTEDWDYFFSCKEIKADCVSCNKMPLCYGLVCPSYPGNVKDTCGYDLSDIERLMRILYVSDNEFVNNFKWEN